MTDLPSNLFAVMTNDALGCTPINAEDQANLNTSALANATLALAYEQRTVAMINWATHLARTSRSDESLEAQITERLGMRAEK